MADKANIRDKETQEIVEPDVFADNTRALKDNEQFVCCCCGAVFLDNPVERNLRRPAPDGSLSTIFYTLAPDEKHKERCIYDTSSDNPVWNNRFARNPNLYNLDEIFQKLEKAAKRKTKKDNRAIPKEVLEILPAEYIDNNKMKDGYTFNCTKEKISAAIPANGNTDTISASSTENAPKDYKLTVEIRDINTGEILKAVETTISKDVKIPRNRIQRITIGASSLHLYAASVLALGNRTICFHSGEPVLDHIVFHKNYLDFRGEKEPSGLLTTVMRRIHLKPEEIEEITHIINADGEKSDSPLFLADAYEEIPDSDEPEDKSIIYAFECQTPELKKAVSKTVFDPKKYDEAGNLLKDAPNGPYFVFSARMGYCGEYDGHKVVFGKLVSGRQVARLNDSYNQENKSVLFEEWRQ